MTYLDNSTVLAIQQAALSAGFSTDGFRTALMGSIDPRVVGLIPQVGAPVAQLLADLNFLNRIERLADGSVPLEAWLATAQALAAMQPAQATFRAALDVVVRKAEGQPNPSILGEVPDHNEKIVHQDDMLPAGFLVGALSVAPSVVKLEVPQHTSGQPVLSSGKPLNFLGTGWLIGPRLLMTNHHVVNARIDGAPMADEVDLRLQGAATTAIFDFDSDGSQTVSIQASELLAWDPVLDFAVLKIPDDRGRPPLRLTKDPLQAAPGQYVPVNIVQHATGRPKQFAIRNNLVREVKGDEVQYFTDTRSGSSGSPVLDDLWRVVALHKASRSVSGVSFQGRSTAYVNVGTTIMAIRRHLQELHADLWAEIEPGA